MGDLRLSCEPHFFFPPLNQWLIGVEVLDISKAKGGENPLILE